MFTSSLDVLYISLAVGFVLLVIFTCVAILYLIMILRDVSKVSANARNVSEKVNDVVVKPIAMVADTLQKIEPILEKIKEKRREAMEDDD